jgi:hypothetical protein
MAVHDNREFGQLFAAFTNADVTAAERVRLNELAGQDVGRRGAIAEVEAIHELLVVEASMRCEIMRPVEGAEEADESFGRMAKAAARAGEKMRANMLHPTTIRTFVQPKPSADAGRLRAWLYGAAVAAVLMIAVAIGMLLNNNGAPGLSGGKPGDEVLGEYISVTTQITDNSRELSWLEVKGAASYEVSILDASKAVVLGKTESRRRFTNWHLSTSDMTLLREHQGALFVTVVARDRAGETVGATREPERIEVK